MANKSINELIAAQQVNPGDLFVLEQSGTAKKLTGQILENWLVSFANGHGGIQKIEKTASAGTDPVVDTYTITLADTTTYSFTVTNGQKGDTGEASYVWIKYSSTNPTSNADMYDTPDNWMGIYVGMDATAPADYTAYKWFEIKGAKGDTGDAAAIKSQKVEYASSTSGTVPPDTWGASIPTVPQGNYLWTRITVEFNTGSPIVSYSAARMGIDGTGTVASVAGVAPDQSGNVTLTAADVGAVAVVNNAGAHNAIYRGKNLGTSVTAEQYAAIQSGTFEDMYIGDYWEIGGVVYRIAAFDYYLRCGDQDLTTHHVVIVPDSNLYNGKMNDTNTTEGGYVGSAMYKTGLEQAKTTIKAAFNGHVLKHRVYLTNAVTNGKPSAGAWCDSEVELMNEQMVYGGAIFMPGCDGTTVPTNYRVEKSQLPLFTHRPDLISNRLTFWLRDVVTASSFALVNGNGFASCYDASSSLGVRPAFCVYGGD